MTSFNVFYFLSVSKIRVLVLKLSDLSIYFLWSHRDLQLESIKRQKMTILACVIGTNFLLRDRKWVLGKIFYSLLVRILLHLWPRPGGKRNCHSLIMYLLKMSQLKFKMFKIWVELCLDCTVSWTVVGFIQKIFWRKM